MAAPPPVVPQPLPAADPASPTMEDVGGKGHGFWRPIMIGSVSNNNEINK
jgi:hypothetical protein